MKVELTSIATTGSASKVEERLENPVFLMLDQGRGLTEIIAAAGGPTLRAGMAKCTR